MGTHPIFESDFDCLTDGPKLSQWLPKNYEKMTESKGATGFGRKIIPNKKGKEIVVYEAPDGSDLASFDEILQYLTSAETCKCGIKDPISLEDFNFRPIEDSPKVTLKIKKLDGKWKTAKKLKRKRKSSLGHECKKIKSDPKQENEEKISASSLPQPIAKNSESLKNLENLESPDK